MGAVFQAYLNSQQQVLPRSFLKILFSTEAKHDIPNVRVSEEHPAPNVFNRINHIRDIYWKNCRRSKKKSSVQV